VQLVDTSVWAQKQNPQIKPWFDAVLVQGEICMCHQVALEILAGATSRVLYERIREDLHGVPWLPMDGRDYERAYEVYHLLEQRGTNVRRSVRIADLLIASCAERHGVPLVHYDRDFDTISVVTGQQAEWAAPPGSLEGRGAGDSSIN
jgi:predicted nucleic acid-binding protein